jgi:glycosyltransferase involved in cell wall biosynthesis
MKFNIVFEIKEGPWGGGNQFLKALKCELIKRDLYTKNIHEADVLLFNSHHHLDQIISLKYKFPLKTFIHRIDGPIFTIRNKNLEIDKFIFKINSEIADGSIFQSNFSKKESEAIGLKNSNKTDIIMNAPSLLFEKKKKKFNFRKPEVLISSWSDNLNKGFETYSYLDNNLDFNDFSIKFIGNTPYEFKNIKCQGPMNSNSLKKELIKSDIYLTASVNDPCSNSLIEAIHSGLIPIAINSGGHPEIINDNRLVFSNIQDLIYILYEIKKGNINYQCNLPNISSITEKYVTFSKKVKLSKKTKTISKTKKIKLLITKFILDLRLKSQDYFNYGNR